MEVVGRRPGGRKLLPIAYHARGRIKKKAGPAGHPLFVRLVGPLRARPMPHVTMHAHARNSLRAERPQFEND